MNKQFYFLSPVEVIKVTTHNLDEVAEWCGGSVQETESRRRTGPKGEKVMDKYVLVPTSAEKHISWAFPGMFVTKRLVVTVKNELRATYAVFRRDYFEKNYFDTPKDATDKTWERQETENQTPVKPKNGDVRVTNNVGEVLLEKQKELEAIESARRAAADVLMARRSDAELDRLVADGNITKHDVRRLRGLPEILTLEVDA